VHVIWIGAIFNWKWGLRIMEVVARSRRRGEGCWSIYSLRRLLANVHLSGGNYTRGENESPDNVCDHNSTHETIAIPQRLKSMPRAKRKAPSLDPMLLEGGRGSNIQALGLIVIMVVVAIVIAIVVLFMIEFRG